MATPPESTRAVPAAPAPFTPDAPAAPPAAAMDTPLPAPPPVRVASRLRARVLIAALGAGVLYALAPYVTGLVGGALLYVMLAPAHHRLAAPREGAMRGRLSSGTSAGLLVALALVLVLLPGIWLTMQIVEQAPDILRAAQASPLLARLQGLTIAGYDVGAALARAGGTMASWGSRQAVAVLGGATQAVLDLVIALFGCYYLLVAGDVVWARVRHWVPFSLPSAERLRDRAHSVAEATLVGTALVATLQGTIVGIAFWATGIGNALFWGAVTALCSVLPLFGSALVWLPGTLYLLSVGHVPQAIGLAVAGGVVASNIDNLIRPIVYRRVSDIHPMITLVGAFAGVRMFGLVGVLLGPLAISLFFEIVKLYEEEYG